MANSFDDFFRDLEKKMDDAKKEIDGVVPLDTLFNAEFMNQYTKATTIAELFGKAGLEIVSQEQLDSLTPELIDDTVKEFTNFSSWREMQQKAANEYSIKILAKHGIPAEER